MTGVLLLCDDLMFTSKVAATARAAGLTAATARTTAALLAKATAAPPACVLLDLHNATLVAAELVPALRAAVPGVRVVGFGSHVNVELLKAARSAGCDEVLPRSKFVSELAARLPGWAESGERPA